MLPQRMTKNKKSRIRFKGICAVAKKKGVGREHLYRVLTGERKSPLSKDMDVAALKRNAAVR
jgi:DNA-binding phage protein